MVKLGLVKRKCVATSIHITVRCIATLVVEDLNTDFNNGTSQQWAKLSSTTNLNASTGRLEVYKQGGGAGQLGVQQSIMATSGYVYDFTITIENAFTSNSTIVLEIIDPNNTVIYTQSVGNGNPNPIVTFTHQFTASATGTYLIKVYRTGNQSNGSFFIDDALITHEEEVTQTLCEDFAGYRYGFNGKEKDDEVKGSGNSYDFGARIYDPRLGRWLAVDPFASKYASWSPYSFVDNKPIVAIDPDGKDVVFLIAKDGAEGMGHFAALIQDGEGNWYYISQGADLTDEEFEQVTTSQYLSGGLRGGLVLDNLNTNDIKTALAKVNEISKGSYTDQIVLETSSETDEVIYSNAKKMKIAYDNSDNKKYNVIFNNCVDACQKIVTKKTDIKLPIDIDPRPNQYFATLKKRIDKIQARLLKKSTKAEKEKVTTEVKVDPATTKHVGEGKSTANNNNNNNNNKPMKSSSKAKKSSSNNKTKPKHSSGGTPRF